MPRLAVAVINYNTREHLRTCLTSIVAEGADEVLVIDNGSSDGSIEMVHREFPRVSTTVNAANPGYGAACNQAVRQCIAPYVLLLNSDTTLRPGALTALTHYLDAHPRAGLVGPRLLNLDGTLQRSTHAFPTPLRPSTQWSPADAIARHVPVLRERNLHTWAHDRARRVPWVLGAALAVRRTAFESVEGFDESFFMYSEEVDLSFRLHAANWETHFTPAAEIVHVGGASTSQWRTALKAECYFSMLHYYERHYAGAALALARWVFHLQTLLRAGRDRVLLATERDASRRAQLAEDIRVWQRVLTRTGVGRLRAGALD